MRPVRLFELRSRGPARDEELGLLNGYAEGLRLYRARKFAEARVQFASLCARYPADGPSALFVRRCDTLLSAPPESGWDAVFQMEHK